HDLVQIWAVPGPAERDPQRHRDVADVPLEGLGRGLVLLHLAGIAFGYRDLPDALKPRLLRAHGIVGIQHFPEEPRQLRFGDVFGKLERFDACVELVIEERELSPEILPCDNALVGLLPAALDAEAALR